MVGYLCIVNRLSWVVQARKTVLMLSEGRQQEETHLALLVPRSSLETPEGATPLKVGVLHSE